MAPRANWKGFLRLSLVTCPVALYPATSKSEKISFNQLNRQTGHRIKYLKVDADTGDEVANEDIVKGYMLDKETFVEVTKEELKEVALETSARRLGDRHSAHRGSCRRRAAPAVVYAEPMDGPAPRAPRRVTLAQKNKTFQPRVLAVPRRIDASSSRTTTASFTTCSRSRRRSRSTSGSIAPARRGRARSPRRASIACSATSTRR